MDDIYTQLFTSYIRDIQYRLRKSEEEALQELTELIPMSGEQEVELEDRLDALRSHCCEESFAAGLGLGLRIAWEFAEK